MNVISRVDLHFSSSNRLKDSVTAKIAKMTDDHALIKIKNKTAGQSIASETCWPTNR